MPIVGKNTARKTSKNIGYRPEVQEEALQSARAESKRLHLLPCAGWGPKSQHAQASTQEYMSLLFNSQTQSHYFPTSKSITVYIRPFGGLFQCIRPSYQSKNHWVSHSTGSIQILLYVHGAPWSYAVHSLCGGLWQPWNQSSENYNHWLITAVICNKYQVGAKHFVRSCVHILIHEVVRCGVQN